MGKQGKEKNTKNKAKHTKLMNRKINKIRKDKDVTKNKLKYLLKKHQEVNLDEENQTTEN
ncbi:MAG: hypothetical protein COB60_11940 [Flavobacteriaceae bacterium]|nr:MAG: hypothetical protein COB60_11940 [Flavobacteriaceae bacterium]